MKIRLVGVVLVCLVFALPLLGKTYKSTYPISCKELWPAVKTVLADTQHYEVKASDDAKWHADYEAKHEAHVTVTGAFTQRTNHVTLVAKGTGCEMEVVSNFSGWEHDDRGDFKKRVDDALVKPKDAKPAEPAKAVEPVKPVEPAKPTGSQK